MSNSNGIVELDDCGKVPKKGLAFDPKAAYGETLKECPITLGPDEVWVPDGGDLILPEGYKPDSNKTCTCGIDAIGGGIHSDWCDLYEELP